MFKFIMFLVSPFQCALILITFVYVASCFLAGPITVPIALAKDFAVSKSFVEWFFIYNGIGATASYYIMEVSSPLFDRFDLEDSDCIEYTMLWVLIGLFIYCCTI